MPVQKFRSFAAAREALWGDPGDATYLRKVAWLWAFADRLAPRSYPRGVHKYRTIAEANLARERWELDGPSGHAPRPGRAPD